MPRFIAYLIISILLITIQTTALNLFTVEDIAPDIVLIWIVYLAIAHGQMKGMLWGFFLGLFLDLATQNFIGLSALSKSVCGFFAGYFYNENKVRFTLGSYRFPLIVLFSSFVHNILYFVIFTQGTDIGIVRAVFRFGLATTLYTASFTLLPMFAFARKRLA